MMQDLRTHLCIASEQLRDTPKYSLHGKPIRSVLIGRNTSNPRKLRPHIAKHSSGALSPPMPKREPEDNNNEESSDFTSNSERTGDWNLHLLALKDMLPYYAAAAHNLYTKTISVHFQEMQQIKESHPVMYRMFQKGLHAAHCSLMFAAPPGMHPHPPSLTINGILDHHSSVTSDNSNLNKRSRSPQHTPITLDMSPEAKKARVQNSMRILKDEPVPEGYVRFRFNEDCKYPHCGYREHQTHFHCMRLDCGYSFCDKTRFVQHTARHERLDTLMGGDFQQFRANVSCGRQECVHTTTLGTMQNKASHFHCLKCEFVCTDTNKVVAHRRQHQKLDSIMAAGFEKFTPTQPCNQDSCAHSGKQTHYHCLSCQYAVLGLSQMSAHKYRHMD
ncbi:unnamed protein product [Timema podura]|uniref:C2H2-type domain-containing protein n=1 Tax=Timema podura TaxID=61482 RepID=A0ABN7NNR6_TIMPD|nr:unnamed protein product [Timema podura]